MKKNHIIKSFRINADIHKFFKEACEKLGFSEAQLSRLLLNRALKQLSESKQQAGGFDNLEFNAKELREIK